MHTWLRSSFPTGLGEKFFSTSCYCTQKPGYFRDSPAPPLLLILLSGISGASKSGAKEPKQKWKARTSRPILYQHSGTAKKPTGALSGLKSTQLFPEGC